LKELDGAEFTTKDLGIQRGDLEEKHAPEPYQAANRKDYS